MGVYFNGVDVFGLIDDLLSMMVESGAITEEQAQKLIDDNRKKDDS